MITKVNILFRACLVGCAICAAAGCSDTWDDHYESVVVNNTGGNDGSLWEAIQQNSDLSNFARVIEATGYQRSLASPQVFTVFAPVNTNFSSQEADELIASYNEQKGTVVDDDNTVVKEFVQNHIALYNHPVSELKTNSIVLMNGKYALLSNRGIGNSTFTLRNQLYGNGLLNTIDRPVDYSANIFEQIRKDADLDSVRAFLYNSMFYHKEFDAENSVEGGLDDLGRTVYLDSVWVQRNELYSVIGRIASEDSTYWMAVPTNEEWTRLVEQYTPYFNYSRKAEDLLTEGTFDSLVYTNPRLAILSATAFSQSVNTSVMTGLTDGTSQNDSLLSNNAVLNYNLRQTAWGAPFNYNQYFAPMAEGGVLNGGEWAGCSNGRLMKTGHWNIDPLQTFLRWNINEFENAYLDVSKYETNTQTHDSAYTAEGYYRSVNNTNFSGRVWRSRYVEFVPAVSTVRPVISIGLTGMLSNVGYDIYLVAAPALANDSNATAQQSLPTKFNCTLSWPDATGKTQSRQLVTNATTTGTQMDYILLAENFEFPVTFFGLTEEKPSVELEIECRVSNNEVSRGTFTRTMRFDCVLVVPHGTLQLIDDLGQLPEAPAAYAGQPGLLMMPHGDNKWQWIQLR